MTDQNEAVLNQLRSYRDQISANPNEGRTWTDQDVVDLLDGVISDQEQMTELDAEFALFSGLVDELEPRYDPDRENNLKGLAYAAIGWLRPRITLEAIAEIAEVVESSPMRCPVHDIPDCSPVLNGCNLPTSIPRAVADYIRSAAPQIESDLEDDDQEEVDDDDSDEAEEPQAGAADEDAEPRRRERPVRGGRPARGRDA